jgi:hypothetical protein
MTILQRIKQFVYKIAYRVGKTLRQTTLLSFGFDHLWGYTTIALMVNQRMSFQNMGLAVQVLGSAQSDPGKCSLSGV